MTVQPMPMVHADSSPVRIVVGEAALLWAIAIAVISTAGALPPHLALAARGAVICVASAVAARWLAPDGDVDKTLGIGLMWLALSIAAELAMAGATGRPWNLLLGSVAHPVVRTLTLLGWVVTPSLFVRREDDRDRNRLR